MSGSLYYFLHQTQVPGQKPLFFIHGAGGTHLHWPPNLRRLAGWRIHAPDLPGHGKSIGPARTSIEDYASDLVEFMSSIDISSAIWIGHSMGSAIAMTIAIRHPERVEALVLIGSGAKLGVHPEILSTSANPILMATAVDLMIARLYGSKADPKLRELGTIQLLESGAGVLHGDLIACDQFDIRSQLNKITQPTLILCGRDDRMTPVKFSEYLAANIANSSLSIHPDGGHMLMLEQPEWVQKVIENYLQPFKNQGTPTVQESI